MASLRSMLQPAPAPSLLLAPSPLLHAEKVITSFQGSHGFALQTPGVGAQANDDVLFLRGSRSLKLTSDGVHSVTFNRLSGQTIDLTGKCPKIWVYIDRPDWIEELWLMMSSDSWTNNITWKLSADTSQFTPTPNSWVPVTLPWGAGELTLSPNRAAIVSIQLRVRDSGSVGTPRPVNVNFGCISKVDEASSSKGVVTMDDGYDSQISVALPILSAVGIPAQMFVIPELVGTANYATWAQLRNAEEVHGWEVSPHTAENLTTVSSARGREILKRNQERLLNQGLSAGSRHLALANGAYNSDILDVTRELFDTVRTIANYGETCPPGDWHRMRVKQVLNTATTATSALATAITAAATNKQLFLPVYHRFSGATDPTTMDRSTASFTTDAANFAASSIQWMTMSRVVR